MYKTIVVPLDQSERAERILPHVEALAGIKLGRVILLHVVEPPLLSAAVVHPSGGTAMAPETYVTQLDILRAEADSYLSRIRAILKTKNIDAETRIETGPAAERIVHVAEESDADLIALASHGRTGLSRVFFGSVAAAVLHRSEKPLLLVRSRDSE